MILRDKIKLYHASYTIIKNVDLSLCSSGKDFGKGFYVTTDFLQAQKFVKTAIKKALKNKIEIENQNIGYVSIFVVDKESLPDLAIYEFDSANKEWLHCVANHRKENLIKLEKNVWEEFDILVGKIANDTTNQVLTTYINGLYGEPGSDIADETAIRMLLPNKLSDQVCFRTEKAIETLIFQESVEINIDES